MLPSHHCKTIYVTQKNYITKKVKLFLDIFHARFCLIYLFFITLLTLDKVQPGQETDLYEETFMSFKIKYLFILFIHYTSKSYASCSTRTPSNAPLIDLLIFPGALLIKYLWWDKVQGEIRGKQTAKVTEWLCCYLCVNKVYSQWRDIQTSAGEITFLWTLLVSLSFILLWSYGRS